MTLWTISCALAATLEVAASPGVGQYGAVQDAVDAAAAGDVIQIGAGTFDGHIQLTEDVTLRGAGMDVTFLTSADGLPYVVELGAAVVIEDLTLDGGGGQGGIEMDWGSSAEIARVKIRDGAADFGGGIRVRAGAALTLTHSVICDNVGRDYGGGVFIDSDRDPTSRRACSPATCVSATQAARPTRTESPSS